MNDAGQFYTNRVLKDWKEKDRKHVDWCKSWIQTLTELQVINNILLKLFIIFLNDCDS